MVGGSVRKRHSKRAPPAKPLNSSMAPLSRHSRLNYRKLSLLVSALVFVSTIALLSVWSNARGAFGLNRSSEQIYTIEVINEFPHDRNAFTQGLLYSGSDTLFESTGLNGRSSVRKVALRTGKVEAIHRMEHSYFGEGLTLLGDRLYQVTWLENTGFIYDSNNLSKYEKFTHQMQDGWGLATDGKLLFGTDGSSTLYQIDPQKMKVIEKHTVKYKGHEVHNLNELEYVNGEVWANVWMTDCIARISSKDGLVFGWILLPSLREGLIAAGERGIDVLNGIAWDKEGNRIFVTGKLWPKLYEIKLHPLKKPVKADIKKMCIREPVHFSKP